MKHCDFCHRDYNQNEHDPCIKDLPGVLYACCGHGKEIGYIHFENGINIEFDTDKIGKMFPAKGRIKDYDGDSLCKRTPSTDDFWNDRQN